MHVIIFSLVDVLFIVLFNFNLCSGIVLLKLTEFASLTAIKIHFGELLLSALLCCLKINHDM
jgi:hypothetical protein